MRLTHHIALRFLTDNTFIFEVIEHRHPGILKAVVHSKPIPGDKEHRVVEAEEADDEKGKLADAWNEDFPFLNAENQKAYIVTDSVSDKLDLLKVKRGADSFYDWSVFAEVRPCKKTFIMAPTPAYKHGTALRLYITPEEIKLAYLRGVPATEAQILEHARAGKMIDFFCKGTILRINRSSNEHIYTKGDEKYHEFYEFTYKLLCFFFLSENDIEVIQRGATHGQKKSGKFKNDLPIPVRIINSKWNITSIRTDGFLVSGHFALRRCGPGRTASRMVYIEPYQKHGYIRRGGKEFEK